MTDPGFPRGAANPGGERQPIIWSIFPENCMKMKKFWAGEGGPSLAPPRSANEKNLKENTPFRRAQLRYGHFAA